MTRLKSTNICCLFGIFLLLLPTFGISQITAEQKAEIDKMLSAPSQSTRPGGAVAIVENGELLYSKAFGLASLEHEVKNLTTTKFQAGDLANQFTAFAALLLVEEGKISLEDDIRKYLPELPKYEHPIRVKHLMTHTHGLPDYMNLQLTAGLIQSTLTTADLVLKAVGRIDKLSFEPGTAFSYTNTGFVFLSKIIERVSEQPFNIFAKEKIFDPIGMNNTFFQQDKYKIVKNKVTSYTEFPSAGILLEDLNYHKITCLRLYSSPEDLAKWMQFVFSKENHSAALKDFNTTTTIGEDVIAPGQFGDTYRGVEMLEHNGLAYGNMSYMCRFPNQKLGIVFVSNLTQFPARGKALEIADLFLKNDISVDQNATEQTPNGNASSQYISMKKKQLEAFTGNYWEVHELYARRIYLRDDTLRYERQPGNESPIVPIGENRFRMLTPGNNLILHFKHEGSKKQMTLTINDSYSYHFENYTPAGYTMEELKNLTGSFFCEKLGVVYDLKIKNGSLVAEHIVQVDKVFQPVTKDHFTSPTWYFSSIKFERNASGDVTGFVLESSGLSALLFHKI